jgi:hypothetical protein
LAIVGEGFGVSPSLPEGSTIGCSEEDAMFRLLLIVVVGSVLPAFSGQAHGQTVIPNNSMPFRVGDYAGLPTLYGTSWGVASFGIPRTYTTFSSPYGAGYGYGYQNSYGVLPGRYGSGLWRPGFVAPGYTYGAAYGYNTFPYPYKAGGPMYGPSIGVYAPGFGPGLPSGFYAQ